MKCGKKSSYTHCGTPAGNGGMFCGITNREVSPSEECIFQRKDNSEDTECNDTKER